MDKSKLPPTTKGSSEYNFRSESQAPPEGWFSRVWSLSKNAGEVARRRSIQRRVKTNAAQQRYKVGK